ncbi:MAG: DUF4258 domain-containing protein [Deltaproteobacteria bacterium]|nr:DUF4258 domain-containing protein [Deltaproteobacteria bacterium]
MQRHDVENALAKKIDFKSIIDIMLHHDYRAKRLDKNQARKRVSAIAREHPKNIRFSRHALEEMLDDDLITADILNVIKSSSSKILGEAELENGSYRYRLETNNIMVVVSFDSEDSLVVVTAWRKNALCSL